MKTNITCLKSIAETCGLLPHIHLKHTNMLMNLTSRTNGTRLFPFRRSNNFAVSRSDRSDRVVTA